MGTDRRAVWALNLDAELELAHRGRSRDVRDPVPPYRPSARVLELVRRHRARLAALLPSGDRVLDEADPPGAYEGLRGRAYCPTPSALAALARAGAVPDPAPPLEVLLTANDRAFCARLFPTLPGQAFVRDEAALDAHLRANAHEGGSLLKRRWSMSGRGHRRVGRALDEADRRFVGAVFRDDGGLLVEPFVAIALEAAIHGWLSADGALAIGAPCVQVVDARRAFVGARRAAGELDASEERALVDAARNVGAALGAAGYFGPFGVDAFRYAGPDGAPAFRAISEVNARLTMALPIGLAIPR